MVSLVSSPLLPQPLGPPPQPPLLSHLQLPHDFQIWTGKEPQIFFERISDLFPRIAVITPPQTSNPFTDLKPTFNQGLQKKHWQENFFSMPKHAGGRSQLSKENINLLTELSRKEKDGKICPDDCK